MSAGGRQRARGFTLTEVLLVVALMAILSMMVVSGSGMLSGTRLRSAATLIMSSVRAAMTQANSNGRPVRLVFDRATAGTVIVDEIGITAPAPAMRAARR